MLIDFEHLKKNKESYVSHFLFAFPISISMIISGIGLMIHCFLPFLFVDIGSKCLQNNILKIQERRCPK